MPVVQKSSTGDTKPMLRTFVHNHMRTFAVLRHSVVVMKITFLFFNVIAAHINFNRLSTRT